jgi:uncharacterized protein
LHLKGDVASNAQKLGLATEKLESELAKVRQKLFNLRESRAHPHKDDKILADWNGLMIAALAKGAQVLDDEEGRYLSAAKKAFRFITEKLAGHGRPGHLFHRFRAGEAAVDGNADDYAFMLWGAIELYLASFDLEYLKQALNWADILLEDFWDSKSGGLFFTSPRSEKLIVRKKESYDGAVPSANSVAMWNLLRLARMTGNLVFEERALEIGRAFSEEVATHPSAHNMLLVGLDFGLGPTSEVVVAGPKDSSDARGYLQAMVFKFAPGAVFLFRPSDQTEEIVGVAPYTKSLQVVGDEPTIYVCHDFACEKPTHDLASALEKI